jgi:hypothetical protein
MKEPLATDLLLALRDLLDRSPEIATLAQGRRNRIIDVAHEGVWLETDASERKGTGPQLVEAWMLNVAWRHLQAHGTLTNSYLLATDGLNVKRSSAVCALLAALPGVSVVGTRPIELSIEAP